MTTKQSPEASMAIITAKTKMQGVLARVNRLRRWADAIETLDPDNPIIDDRICDGGICAFAASLIFEGDEKIIPGIEFIKKRYAPPDILKLLIKPEVKRVLLEAERQALKEGYPLPAWQHPPWISQ